jgi:hypothetical protein
MNPEGAIRGSSLKQKHFSVAIGRQPIGQHATGGPAADNHVIKLGAVHELPSLLNPSRSD